MIKQYALEIYEPGSAEDVAMSLESDTAFGALARGNLLHVLSDGATDFFARVVGIEHIVWQIAGLPKHKICVFTERAENSRENRLK
jgi:hypothetical protein